MKIIGGKYANRTLAELQGAKLRPTAGKLREALFNICQGYIEGARFLDLFAGVGAVGFEALSRGAAKVTFVEKEREALELIQKNIKRLEERKGCRILPFDVFAALPYLAKRREQFDMIFADPPYGQGLSEEVLHFVDTHDMLKDEGELFLEDEQQESRIELERLTLISARRMGRAFLRQYRKKP